MCPALKPPAGGAVGVYVGCWYNCCQGAAFAFAFSSYIAKLLFFSHDSPSSHRYPAPKLNSDINLLKSCHTDALSSRSTFDGCRQLSWWRPMQSCRTTSTLDSRYQLKRLYNQCLMSPSCYSTLPDLIDVKGDFMCIPLQTPTYRRSYIFGAERRMCRGVYITERSLLLAVTRLQ